MDENQVVPGTVHLVDLEGILRTKHASGHQRDIVLVPSPSNDPEDPLNWSKRRKLISTVSVCMYTFAVGIASAAIYSVLVPIEEATGLTLNNLNAGTGYMFLMFGWGCLVWQPLALQYGKRPVYLISILATMAIMIWVPYTTTNGQWIASKLLQGFFGAPIESLCEISITDVYFTHERGNYIAIYGISLVGSSFLAPILAGFIQVGQGWKWVLYWCAILCAIGFVFLFFFMEETNYHRVAPPHETPGNRARDESPVSSTLKNPEDSLEKGNTRATSHQQDIVTIDMKPLNDRKRKTHADKLKIFNKEELKYPNRLTGMAIRPLIFLTFPVILYAGFSYGSNLIWFNVLNGTASLILSNKPYEFSSSSVGLAYTSPLIGALTGFIYTGRIGDWVVLRMARQNGGIMESEFRLWLFSASIVLLPASLILWGVGAAHNIHWFGLIFAMGIIGFTNSVGLQLSVNYCIDSYRELSGEAIVTVILVRNTMSFAVGYGITPWVTNLGLRNAFIVAAFAGLAQVLTFLLFIRYGRRMRRASVMRYEHYTKEMMAAGLVH